MPYLTFFKLAGRARQGPKGELVRRGPEAFCSKSTSLEPVAKDVFRAFSETCVFELVHNNVGTPSRRRQPQATGIERDQSHQLLGVTGAMAMTDDICSPFSLRA